MEEEARGRVGRNRGVCIAGEAVGDQKTAEAG